MQARGSSDLGEASGPVVALRRPGPQLFITLWLFVCVAVPCLIATLSPYVLWWGRVLTGLACLPVAVLIWRIGGLAIYAEPDDLVIRNFRNTHRIPWWQIEDIDVTPPIPASVYRENPLAEQTVSLLVRLREGAVISATLYDSRMFRRSSTIQPRKRAVEQLNALWRERSVTADPRRTTR